MPKLNLFLINMKKTHFSTFPASGLKGFAFKGVESDGKTKEKTTGRINQSFHWLGPG